MKRPAFQWYPGDWRRDTALESCSIEARGLWIEMLNLMHDGEPYGYLTAAGVPIDARALGNLTGVPPSKLSKILRELEQRKIFSRSDTGVIYSRRMVRDEGLRNRRAAGGKLGGNPALVAAKDNTEATTGDTEVHRKVNHDPTPATATATATATALQELVVNARIRFAVAANRGLAEHATAAQPIPPISPNAGRTLEITESILASGVPIEFAETRIYELARSHTAERKITSLKYFEDFVIRAWEESQKPPPNGARKRQRPAAETPGERSYADATAAFAALNGEEPR